MQAFTFFDYLYYNEFFDKLESVLVLNEDTEEYIYQNNKIQYPHDKLFKKVLDNKKEIVYFLNKELNLENTPNALQEKDIEKYNREFITGNFYKLESDIVYKIKDKNIFFLIEHQSKINTLMAYRILKYSMAIMDSAINLEKIGRKDYKLPKIYSFVIYTGKQKWNINNNLESMQERLEGVPPEEITYFRTVDVNNFSRQELLEEKSLLSKIMLLEKVRNTDDIGNYIKEILNLDLKKEDKYFLEIIIKYIFKNQISDSQLKEIIKKFNEEKEGEKSMFEEVAEQWYQKYVAAPLKMVKDAQDEFARSQNEFEKSKDEFAKSQNEFEKSQNKLKKEREEFEKSKGEFEKSKGEFEKSKGEFEKSKGEFEKSKGEFEKSKNKFEKSQNELKKEREEFEKQKINLEKREKEIEKEKNQIKKELENLKKLKNTLK